VLEQRPAQEATCTNDEAPDDNLVLVTVALEAQCHDIVLLGVLADVDALVETERLGAFGALRLGRPGLGYSVGDVGAKEASATKVGG
jgi:hypothetical protein